MALQLIYVVTVLALLNQESQSQLSDCGQPRLNSRIVGGQAAPEGSWPWQVSLHTSGHFCGGSLINNQWVLSAAHCFSSNNPSGLTVFLGRQSQEGSNPNEVSRTVSQIILHPDYNSGTNFNNDIALLRLSSSVNFTNFIAPVCLAASNSTFFSGVDTWVTGWGTIGSGVPLPSPQNLMEVEVPIVGNRGCKCNYGVNAITDNMVCAGLSEGGKDSCQGDSGGPLVSKQGGRWIQAGIVSFGEGCAEPNLPGVYARVSRYETWINSQITSNQPGFISFTSTGTDSDLSVSCSGVPAITNTTTTATTTTTTTTPNTTTSPPQSTTPKPVVCGQASLNSRILGGSSVARAGEWPWMASLQKNGRHVCGGTLVAVDSVMSNANCFSGSPVASEWTVVLGRLKQNGSNPFEVSLSVTNITLSNLTGSNVAVLQLSARPTLTVYIQPICLDTGRSFPVGSTCWIAGWSSGRGREEQVLQEFQTTIQNCGNASTADSICTGQFTLEQGDSGGPLMCKSDGSWFQPAVLSFAGSSNRRKRDTVMVFEKLTRFQTFLTRSLGTFLSPTSNTSTTVTTATTATTASTTLTTVTTTSGSSPVHSSILLSLHLLVLSLCLQLFS
ncbi:polyserase-2-like isoform 2-T2 [Odontesthes bonariensis]|uniref:polyserase-2-like isoform X2 n=1 Tax=Odontesthes bonariensis TaxID=219752 RepID=UPI003F58F3FD